MELDELAYYPGEGRGPYRHNDEGDAVPLSMVGDWGECKAGAGTDNQPALTETLVFAKDASSFHASLSTHKTFGCVMHPLNKE